MKFFNGLNIGSVTTAGCLIVVAFSFKSNATSKREITLNSYTIHVNRTNPELGMQVQKNDSTPNRRDSSTRHHHSAFKVEFGKKDTSRDIAHSEKSDKAVYFGVDPGLDIGFASFLDHGNASLSGYNSYLNLNRAKSSNVTLDIIKLKIRLDPHRFRLYSGLGIDWTNYRFENDFTLRPTNVAPIVYDPAAQYDVTHFSKNKLTMTYLRMPLLLRVNLGPASSGLFVAAGLEAGYLISAHTKQISKQYGKVKVYNDYYLNPWRTAIQARIGYRDFNIYGKYYLSKVFNQAGAAPDITSFAIGISFGGF